MPVRVHHVTDAHGRRKEECAKESDSDESWLAPWDHHHGKVKMYPTLGMLMCQHHTCSIIFAARYWGALYVPDINTTYARRNPNRFVTFPRRYDPIPDER